MEVKGGVVLPVGAGVVVLGVVLVVVLLVVLGVVVLGALDSLCSASSSSTIGFHI